LITFDIYSIADIPLSMS